MRLHIALVLLAWASFAQGEDRFPYKAYVTVNETPIYSGPGDGFYVTEKLPLGAEVEIHRQGPNGWYAVRPMEESFSWVAAWHLQIHEDGLAEVIADRAAARVGSQFSDVREVVQVQLKRGEMVEIRGSKRSGSGGETMTWYRIFPPPGEFRWIDSKFVSTQPPVRTPAGTTFVARPVQDPPERPVPNPAPITASPPVTPPAEKPGGWAAAEKPLASEPPAVSAPPPTAAAPAAPAAPSAAIVNNSVASPQPAVPIRQLPPEEFQSQLEAVDAELAVMLSSPPGQWNCDPLARRAESLVLAAQSAAERAQARQLLDRITRAMDVHGQAVATVSPPGSGQTAASPNPLRSPIAPSTTADGNDRFDGSGRLTRVMPAKLGDPRYALVDPQGKVRCYVTPAPGVNMQYYVGRQVGVNGTSGPLGENTVPHVTARHVSPLEARTLR